MFLGGGDRGGVEANGSVNGNSGEGSRRSPVGENGPVGPGASTSPLSVRTTVWCEILGFCHSAGTVLALAYSVGAVGGCAPFVVGSVAITVSTCTENLTITVVVCHESVFEAGSRQPANKFS